MHTSSSYLGRIRGSCPLTLKRGQAETRNCSSQTNPTMQMMRTHRRSCVCKGTVGSYLCHFESAIHVNFVYFTYFSIWAGKIPRGYCNVVFIVCVLRGNLFHSTACWVPRTVCTLGMHHEVGSRDASDRPRASDRVKVSWQAMISRSHGNAAESQQTLQNQAIQCFATSLPMSLKLAAAEQLKHAFWNAAC